MTNDVPGTGGGLDTGTKSKKDPTGWGSALNGTIDTSGTNIPTGAKTTYAQLYQAIESDATRASYGGNLWGTLVNIMRAKGSNLGYPKSLVNDFKSGFGSHDAIALKNLLTKWYNANTNAAPGQVPWSFSQFATTQRTALSNPSVQVGPPKIPATILSKGSTATPEQQINDILHNYIIPKATQLGSSLSTAQLQKIASDAYNNGTYRQTNVLDQAILNGTNIASTLGTDAGKNPLGGGIGNANDQIIAVANDYGIQVPKNPAQLAAFIKNAVGPGGDGNQVSAFTEYAKNQAIAAHPEMASAIKAGITVNKYNASAASVDNLIAEKGLAVDPATRAALINHLSVNGWSVDDPRTLNLLTSGHDLSKQQTDAHGNPLGGTIGAAQDSFASIASDYGVTLPTDPTQMANFVKGAVGANPSTDAFKEYARQQAELNFPWMAKSIQAGATVKGYLSQFTGNIASTLGIPAESINWSDPKWQSVVAAKAPDGTTVPQTLDQAMQTIKTDPRFGYSKTPTAINEAYSNLDAIGQMFGKQG